MTLKIYKQAVYYTSPQSFKNVFLIVSLTTLGLLMNHPIISYENKTAKIITGSMCSLPEIENPIGSVFIEILSFRQKKPYYFIY